MGMQSGFGSAKRASDPCSVYVFEREGKLKALHEAGVSLVAITYKIRLKICSEFQA